MSPLQVVEGAEQLPPLKSPEQWTAGIPDPVKATVALDLIKSALEDADNRILIYKTRGTVPPPPWPVHPALRKAIEAMEGGRAQLAVAINFLGKGDLTAAKGTPRWVQLQKGGEALYRELGVLDANMAKGIDLPAAAAKAAKSAVTLTTSVVLPVIGALPAWVLLAGAWYFLRRGKGRRSAFGL